MSNTSISPSVATLTATGVALAMGLVLAPVQSESLITGIAPTVTAASAQVPAFNGQPLSWSALTANAAGAAITLVPFRQARLTVSGTFGSFGAALLQVSPDNVNWSTIAAMSDAVSPGAVMGEAAGLRVTPIPGGVVLSVTDPSAIPFRYVRAAAQNGDGSTSLSVSGFVSATGSV